LQSAGQGRRDAVAIEPIAAIIKAFQSHPVVALGEGEHNNEQGHAFRLALIRDPRFAAIVNDIVVEFGSARYQSICDQYISGGHVAPDVLRKIWQDTTQMSSVWDVSIYEEFFHAVRAVNQSLAKERQLRVLLGDPPVDWQSGHSIQAQTRELGTRDGFAADLIRREVLSRRRRALVVYGDMHFARIPGPPEVIVERLENAGAKIFRNLSFALLVRKIGILRLATLGMVNLTRFSTLDIP
jgi:hypothetical protein